MKKRVLRLVLGAAFAACPVHATGGSTAEAAGQDLCRLVSPEEGATVLGARPETHSSEDACYYVVRGQSMQLVIGTESGYAEWQAEQIIIPDRKKKGYSVQDEPSFGKGSFSARKPGLVEFVLLVKNTRLEVELIDEGKEIPAALFEKLRDIAKKAAGRF